MIRASNLHRICTSRLEDNSESLQQSKQKLIEKVEAKKLVFSEDNIETYTTTQGLMTVAKDYIAEKEKYEAFLRDDLPMGAKTYMKELWLEMNYGFVSFSLGEEAMPLRKGKMVEEEAIKLIGQLYNIELSKNVERVTIDFLTGEGDVVYRDNLGSNIIRDNKSPISWNSFKNKIDISTEYYWQLIGYCYLYNAKEAYLDYTLMPTPKEILEEVKDKLGEEGYNLHLQMNENILKLEPRQRVKTFKLQCNLEDEIQFMLARVEKCKLYYQGLNYESCMNIFENKES